MRSPVFFLFLTLCSSLTLQAEPLVPVSVSLINSDFPLEPSGLARCGDKMLLISDKFDAVFWLKPAAGESRADVYFQIAAPLLPKPEFSNIQDELKQQLREMATKFTYDWEAVACDDAGHVFIASERNTNVLQVDVPDSLPAGAIRTGKWMLNGFDAYAKQRNFFGIFNAGLESMTWYKGQFILAAEREPRGLFTLDAKADGSWVVSNMAEVRENGLPLVVKTAKKADFADLYVENDKLYSLERYTAAVCRRSLQTYAQERCWTYAHLENDPKWEYQDHEFGIAEGMTVFQNRLYVAMDNNLKTRKAAPDDARPLLLEFQLPANWRE